VKKFVNKLDALITKDEIEMEHFFIQVEILLKTIKQDMITAFQNKQNTFSSIVQNQEKDSNYYEKFYMTSKERVDTLRNVLSYLLLMSKHYFALLCSGVKNNTNDNLLLDKTFFASLPYEYSEFVKNIHFLEDLLLSKDVNSVIFKNYKEAYPTAQTNEINNYMKEHYEEFKKIAPSKNNFKISNYMKLIEALRHLSLFWFKINGYKEDKIRKTDIYIYQLCRVFFIS